MRITFVNKLCAQECKVCNTDVTVLVNSTDLTSLLVSHKCACDLSVLCILYICVCFCNAIPSYSQVTWTLNKRKTHIFSIVHWNKIHIDHNIKSYVFRNFTTSIQSLGIQSMWLHNSVSLPTKNIKKVFEITELLILGCLECMGNIVS